MEIIYLFEAKYPSVSSKVRMRVCRKHNQASRPFSPTNLVSAYHGLKEGIKTSFRYIESCHDTC